MNVIERNIKLIYVIFGISTLNSFNSVNVIEIYIYFTGKRNVYLSNKRTLKHQIFFANS